MEQSDLLRYVTEVFNRLGIPYFVTGSWGTFAYGEPRLTHDIDIVTRLTNDQVDPFCASFPQDQYYVSPEAVRDAINRRSQFNILLKISGAQVDRADINDWAQKLDVLDVWNAILKREQDKP